MKNVHVEFEPLENDTQSPSGLQFIQCHVIFDVKMENFHWKVRLVAGEHMTNVPPTVTYVSVVLRETLCIALTMAALSALKVMAADIMNAFITKPNKEKMWILLGPEFGKDKGHK